MPGEDCIPLPAGQTKDCAACATLIEPRAIEALTASEAIVFPLLKEKAFAQVDRRRIWRLVNRLRLGITGEGVPEDSGPMISFTIR
jgi:hypothetical protein